MQVRLAFAISTSVGGDVLLLDEVIGAGDAAFMGKARDRVAGLINASEIMILASHDLASLRQLCTRALVLEKGAIVHDGTVDSAAAFYAGLTMAGRS
jgi:lipopolysaccharide transport system ATP-binding protein